MPIIVSSFRGWLFFSKCGHGDRRGSWRGVSRVGGFDLRAEVAHREERDDDEADEQAIADKDARRMCTQETQQKPDRGITDDARHDGRDDERQPASIGQLVQSFFEFEQSARADGRYRKQERESGSRLARLARKEATHDRRA